MDALKSQSTSCAITLAKSAKDTNQTLGNQRCTILCSILCWLFHYTFVVQDIPIFFSSSSRRKYLCQDKDESCCSLLIFNCIVVIVLNFIAFIVLSVIIKCMKDFGVNEWNSFDFTGLIFHYVLCLHLSWKVWSKFNYILIEEIIGCLVHNLL